MFPPWPRSAHHWHHHQTQLCIQLFIFVIKLIDRHPDLLLGTDNAGSRSHGAFSKSDNSGSRLDYPDSRSDYALGELEYATSR